jgi:hypothetical protein
MAFGTDTMTPTRRRSDVHWSQVWHPWFLLMPSRGIDGQLLFGASGAAATAGNGSTSDCPTSELQRLSCALAQWPGAVQHR